MLLSFGVLVSPVLISLRTILQQMQINFCVKASSQSIYPLENAAFYFWKECKRCLGITLSFSSEVGASFTSCHLDNWLQFMGNSHFLNHQTQILYMLSQRQPQVNCLQAGTPVPHF